MFFKGYNLRPVAIVVNVVIYCQIAYVRCHKYVVSTEPVNWYQALINCKSAGMELASIHSAEELEELDIYLQGNKYDKGYWIAGTREGNGQFYWATTGVKTVYTKWHAGQPDDTRLAVNFNEGEKCIQWGWPTLPSDVAGWNDYTCSQPLPYICQRTQYCYQ